jgi:hypothetical protein
LGAIADEERPEFMGDFGEFFDRSDVAEDVRDLGHRDDFGVFGDGFAEIFDRETAIFIERDVFDFGAGHLADFEPRKDVRGVLGLGQKDLVILS